MTDLDAVAKVLRTYLEFPSWGGTKLSDFLCNQHIAYVSPGTAQKIKNKLNKLIDSSEYKLSVLTRYEAMNPGDMWAIDWLQFNWYDEKLYVAILHDDNSRFVINWGITASPTTQFAINLIDEAILRYGAPNVLKSDNGPEFRMQFAQELVKRGIIHLNTPVYTPEYNGKLERLNRDVRHIITEFKEYEQNLELSNVITGISEAILDHNYVRPHQALDGITPAQRFNGEDANIKNNMQSFKFNENVRKGTSAPNRDISEKSEPKGIVAPIRRDGNTILSVRTFSLISLQKVLD